MPQPHEIVLHSLIKFLRRIHAEQIRRVRPLLLAGAFLY